jgi:hypothetical protein
MEQSRGPFLRLLMALCALALLVVAWRGQHAFQYAIPRAPGGWSCSLRTAVAALLLFASVHARRKRRRCRLASSGRWLRRCVCSESPSGWCTLRRPEGMNHDAGWYGQYANEILRGTPYTPYIAAAWDGGNAFMYVVACFIKIRQHAEALQAGSTVWGIAALLPYVLARAMFGPRVALAALDSWRCRVGMASSAARGGA